MRCSPLFAALLKSQIPEGHCVFVDMIKNAQCTMQLVDEPDNCAAAHFKQKAETNTFNLVHANTKVHTTHLRVSLEVDQLLEKTQ